MNRIALVEDHARLAGMVKEALLAAGIECDVFGRIDDAWSAFRNTSYPVLIVDRGLPDGDGLALVRRLREAGNQLPCLMLTARDAVHDRIEGLESGADDYLAKPFSMEELIARVRALMRRPAHVQSLAPVFGDIQILPESGVLVCGSESVSLAPAELQIMISLVQAGGKTMRRTAIEVAAWGLTGTVTLNALDVAMHRLRKKLQVAGSSVQIVNLRGLGYALSDTAKAP